MKKSSNVVWQHHEVSRAEREALLEQRGRLIWFTGLSGSGKSTLAARLERRLIDAGRSAYLLDGDNLRHGLCNDLRFTPDDRRENVRRIGEVGRLMVDAGLLTIAAFISPFRADRERIRGLFPSGEFIEVHVSTSLAVCEERDVKGLYARARAGEIPNFTGISSPYEAPEHAELVIDTASISVDAGVDEVLEYLSKLPLTGAPRSRQMSTPYRPRVVVSSVLEE